jgi:hypothetical protein
MNARIAEVSRVSTRTRVVSLFLSVAASTAGWAHHSGSEYDDARTVEIEGTLLEVRWQNPHIHLSVRSARDARSEATIWDIEGSSLSVMSRANVTRDKLKVGDKVRVAGWVSRKSPNRMMGLNVLQADGTELVFLPGIPPRWASATIGSWNTWLGAGTSEKASSGLFRVWSTKLDAPEQLWLPSYPLTDAAKKVLASWDSVNDTVSPDCEPKGMPTIMETPYPLEFVRMKDTILLRMEEYDTVRTIHMSDKAAPSSLHRNRLGRSMGRWEGSTLVVKTDGITWPYIDPAATPLSAAATLVERFTPTGDGTGLQYSVVITDAQFLTAPVELKRSWVARPNESVKPYNCGRS